MKMRTEIRKHRTLPNDHFQEKCLLQVEDHDEDNFNEKIEILNAHKSACPPPLLWSIRHTTQLALPPRLDLISNHNNNLLSQDQDLYSSSSTSSLSSCIKFNQQDSDDDDEDNEHNYVYGSSYSYSMTLQKLSGISFEDQNKPETNTAVLITLSPCALAAANAARQKRQKIRTYHH
jgi:hypothetical protein